MAKIQQQTQIPASPFPIVIAGTLVKGKENYLTIGAYGGMSIQPPMVYISSMKAHYSNIGIKETGYFSINLPPAGLVRETDYCGLVSGRDIDKSRLFTPFYGEEKLAPMVRECPVNAVCRLEKTVDLPNNDVFIGEVVEYYVDDNCLDGKNPDPGKTAPLLLYGRSYRRLGRIAGTAFAAGKVLMKKS
ncbi:MAG TPA: flavin reductase family protein [Methanomicrobiales archaeon]|nr:flavin reductase family protein [Methanomicrobiales archaeon]